MALFHFLDFDIFQTQTPLIVNDLESWFWYTISIWCVELYFNKGDITLHF